jgi:GNAT superfamily N-acetyltransferase
VSTVQIVHAITPQHIDWMRDLLREYIAWTETLHSLDDVPAFEGIEEELAGLPGAYAPPHGRLLLALVDREPVGCVCLKPIDEAVCDLKRMYVKPSHRGLSIGQKLGKAVVDAAVRYGYTKIVLDTFHTMHAAHAVYRRLGFKVVPTPSDVPEFVQKNAIFMEMVLD